MQHTSLLNSLIPILSRSCVSIAPIRTSRISPFDSVPECHELLVLLVEDLKLFVGEVDWRLRHDVRRRLVVALSAERPARQGGREDRPVDAATEYYRLQDRRVGLHS